MISRDGDFNEFLDAMKNLSRNDIIREAEKEEKAALGKNRSISSRKKRRLEGDW